MSNWVKLGELGINSGTVLICDASDLCYVEHGIEGGVPGVTPYAKPPLVVAPVPESMQAVQEAIWLDLLANHKQFTQVDKTYENGATMICGILGHTGYGDGSYEIFGRIEDGRLMEIRIRFDEAVGWDNPETKEEKSFVMKDVFNKVCERQNTTDE